MGRRRHAAETPSMIIQIRNAVRSSGRSLAELSESCGLHHGQLSRFMRDERGLSLESAARLCEHLGIRLVGPTGEELPKTEELRPSKPANGRRKDGRKPGQQNR